MFRNQLRSLVKKLLNNNNNNNNSHNITALRNISLCTAYFGKSRTYEGDGKTSVHILNNEADLGIMINGISQVGFRLNNEMTVLGPMLIFPRSVLSWNVESVRDINEDSLALFTIMEPRADILVIGVGDQIQDMCVYKELLPLGRKLRLSLEVLPTEQACSTFNFLNSEGRFVVGALIPPKTLIVSDDDLVQTKLRYQNIYETEEPFKL